MTTSLHLVTSDARRGAETFAVELAAELEIAGHVARVAALAPSGMEEVHQILTLGPGRRAVRTLSRLRQEARRADVVVAHGSSTLEACALGLTGTGVPFVYRTIGDPDYWAGEGWRRRRVGWMLRRAARNVVLWPDAADRLVQAYGIPRHNIDVVPNAVDERRFTLKTSASSGAARERLEVPSDLPCLAFVGALSTEKDVGAIVHALADLDGVRLLVAGDGPERRALESLSQRVAPGRVSFLGSVADPRDVYAAADLLVLPSLSEGMPAVVIEAGLMGTPAVATSVGAVPAMIDDGRTGCLVPPQDPAVLATAIRETLPQAPEFGHRAAALFRGRYGMTAVSREWAELMERARH